MDKEISSKCKLHFTNYDYSNKNAMNEALYLSNIRKEPTNKMASVVGYTEEIPIFGYGRTLKYSKHIGRRSISYLVMYACSYLPRNREDNPIYKNEKVITKKRYERARAKWINKI
jgi:hypothetical protein